MRRIIAMFCLALLLVTNTELYQLVKLPVLLEHYHEHKVGEGLSFLSFLQKHYFNGDERSPDYERDMQLPFKTPTFISSVSLVLAVPEQPILELAPVLEKKSGMNSRYSEWLPATALQDIFQPPRA